MLIGMGAAILQGSPQTTLDTDLWVDLPERQYVRLLDLSKKLGATILARTVVALKDDTLVNFCYRVDGLRGFQRELKGCKTLRRGGIGLPVLPLERVIKSKEFIRRDKDLAALPVLKEALRLRKKTEKKGIPIS
ncbi:MAG: hypothetical protein PHD76_04315 [Methylacidiphilales bacterium]|nr:hypothetical protein [Candidatus Methylacidiphilales bacterium]